MNLINRPTFRRWATAAVAALGATTFVAADGFANTRRLYTALYADNSGGSCDIGNGSRWEGEAIAYDGSNNIVCEVNVTMRVGDTNYANQICPNSSSAPNPVTVLSGVAAVYVPTGDVYGYFCTATTNWGSTSGTGCQGYWGGCLLWSGASGY